jgi:hypothetical protein
VKRTTTRWGGSEKKNSNFRRGELEVESRVCYEV